MRPYGCERDSLLIINSLVVGAMVDGAMVVGAMVVGFNRQASSHAHLCVRLST